MELETDKRNGVVVLTPVGRMDAASIGDLQQKLAELIDGGERLLALDLRRTEHVGGAGLRALLMLSRKLESQGGGLVLSGVPDALKEAFEMAGLTGQFTFARTLEDAEATLKKGLAGEQKASPVAEVAGLASELLARAAKREEKKGGGRKA
jgi:anti-anti-sigma factor